MNWTNLTNLSLERLGMGKAGQESDITEILAEVFELQASGVLQALDESGIDNADDLRALVDFRSNGMLDGQLFFVNTILVAADIGKVIFTAPIPCKLLFADERHIATAGQACTMQVERLVDGVAPGSGENLLNTTLDLTSTVNEVVSITGIQDITLDSNDAIATKIVGGSASSYAGVINLVFQAIHPA